MKNINKIKCHSVLDTESSTRAVSQQQQQPAWKILKQVQDDGLICYSNNGFTLLELLVVVLIIGILAAMALPQYQKAVDKARFVQLRTAMDSLEKSNAVYFMANGSYAADWDTFEIPAAGCTLGNTKTILTCPWGTCRNYNGGGNYSCSILLSTGDLVSLEYFPNSGIKHCIASGNNASPSSRAYKLCNSLPHTGNPRDSGCNGVCLRFVLN